MSRCFKKIRVYTTHDGFRSTSLDAIKTHVGVRVEEALTEKVEELVKELFQGAEIDPRILVREFCARHIMLARKMADVVYTDGISATWYSESTEFMTSDEKIFPSIQDAINHAFEVSRNELAAVVKLAMSDCELILTDKQCERIAGRLVNDHVCVRRALEPMAAFSAEEDPNVK